MNIVYNLTKMITHLNYGMKPEIYPERKNTLIIFIQKIRTTILLL